MMTMEKYFFTNDTALAAYFYLRGYEFIQGTLWGDDRRRKQYIIHDQPGRGKDEEDFYLRRTAVIPLDYQDARVAVSRFLKTRVSFDDL